MLFRDYLLNVLAALLMHFCLVIVLGLAVVVFVGPQGLFGILSEAMLWSIPSALVAMPLFASLLNRLWGDDLLKWTLTSGLIAPPIEIAIVLLTADAGTANYAWSLAKDVNIINPTISMVIIMYTLALPTNLAGGFLLGYCRRLVRQRLGIDPKAPSSD